MKNKIVLGFVTELVNVIAGAGDNTLITPPTARMPSHFFKHGELSFLPGRQLYSMKVERVDELAVRKQELAFLLDSYHTKVTESSYEDIHLLIHQTAILNSLLEAIMFPQFQHDLIEPECRPRIFRDWMVASSKGGDTQDCLSFEKAPFTGSFWANVEKAFNIDQDLNWPPQHPELDETAKLSIVKKVGNVSQSQTGTIVRRLFSLGMAMDDEKRSPFPDNGKDFGEKELLEWKRNVSPIVYDKALHQNEIVNRFQQTVWEIIREMVIHEQIIPQGLSILSKYLFGEDWNIYSTKSSNEMQLILGDSYHAFQASALLRGELCGGD